MAVEARSRDVAVLISGGLDSAVLLGELLARRPRLGRVRPIYVRNGLRWETVELFWLRRFLKAIKNRALRPLAALDLPMRDLYAGHWSVAGRRVPAYASDDRDVYLPGRNMILLTKAVLLCLDEGIGRIALGPLNRNPFPDSRPAFFRQMERSFALGIRWRGRILTPYLSMSKPAVIRKGAALRLPLHLTFSCLQPRGRRHCGRCNKCAERQRAFKTAGVPDLTAYSKTAAT